MRRYDISVLSAHRLLRASFRRVFDVPHALMWNKKFLAARQNLKRVAVYENNHKGQRCFIMGNGPSLAQMNLDPLKNEITFGLNRIYLLFDRIPFLPTYYAAVNELVLEQFASEIQALPMPKFLNWNRRALFKRDDEETVYLRVKLNLFDTFTPDLTKPLSSGGTVTFVALQIAYYMGFSEVILIGVDHNFADTGTPNKTETRRSSVDENHFHPNYFPKGSRWQLPDLRRSEAAYEIAREAFEKDNRQILDATVNGKCPTFRKISFRDLF